MEIESKFQYDIQLTMTEEEIRHLANAVTSVFVTYLHHGLPTDELESILAFKDVLVLSTINSKG